MLDQLFIVGQRQTDRQSVRYAQMVAQSVRRIERFVAVVVMAEVFRRLISTRLSRKLLEINGGMMHLHVLCEMILHRETFSAANHRTGKESIGAGRG